MTSTQEGHTGMAQPWDRDRIEKAIEFIRARLAVDLGGTGLPRITFRFDATWATEAAEAMSVAAGSDPQPDDVIVVCGGHEFTLGLESGVEIACADAADALQDDVIDLLGRPWPELCTADGTYVGVLSPTSTGGIAIWRLTNEPFCAVGQLHDAVGASGLTIKSDPSLAD
jgi:hypothetical protein